MPRETFVALQVKVLFHIAGASVHPLKSVLDMQEEKFVFLMKTKTVYNV